MNTKAKANSVITHALFNIDGVTGIAFNVVGAGMLKLDMAKVHSEIIARAALHGMIQRISDAAAISRDPETGLPASPQDKFDAMQKLVEHYESGTAEWSRKPISGEKSGGLLFKALCQMSPSKTPEEIKAWMGTRSKKQLAVIRASERVAAVIATIRPAGDEVDLSELGL